MGLTELLGEPDSQKSLCCNTISRHRLDAEVYLRHPALPSQMDHLGLMICHCQDLSCFLSEASRIVCKCS